MKKLRLVLTALALAAALCACTQSHSAPSSSNPEEPLQLDAIRLELSQFAAKETLLSVMGSLPDQLKSALAEQGVVAKTVEVTVGDSPAATAQALEEGTVDLAIFSGDAFLEAGGSALPMLTARVLSPEIDSADAADWQNVELGWSGTDGGGTRFLIVSGPSDYGRQLSARAASDTPLTWDELNRANWVVGQETGNMAQVWLADHYEGNTFSDLAHLTRSDSSGDDGQLLLSALADGSADIAVIPADARIDFANHWKAGLNRPGGIFQETTVLGVTEKYYDTILAVRPDDELLTGESFRTALAAALAKICSQNSAAAVAMQGVCSVPVSDSALDGMRRLITLGG